MWRKAILLSVLLQSIKSVLPAATPLQPDVPFTDSDPNEELWTPTSGIHPRPERGSLGASILGPQNIPIELQNADLLAPPTTDQGSIKNFKWPFSSSHNKLKDGGWHDNRTVRLNLASFRYSLNRRLFVNDMPLATDIAGVNMRLEAGAIREMHWHATAEWAYVLKGESGSAQSLRKVRFGLGMWRSLVFPSWQSAFNSSQDTTPDGAEFILIFDEGDFSEDATFLLTDWLAHVPKSVLAKNFGMDGNLQAFDHIPEHELYIFPSQPPPDDINKDMVVPNNTPHPFTFQFSKVAPTKKIGGTVKIVDTRTFTVSEKISAAEVEVEVGGMRELHWHPTQPEWTFFICGEARITLFASQSNAATYDFYPGDIAYIPPSFGHYIENTGNTTLRFIEILKTNLFQDISLTQWLALTPPELVKAHLGFSDETIARLSKTKQTLVV